MSTSRKTLTRSPSLEGDLPGKPWELRLYIAGRGPRSAEAWTNLSELCERHLPGIYKLEVVDLTKYPARSREDEILALPTVVRRRPQPEKRVIGRLSDPERVLAALELSAVQDPRSGPAPSTPRRNRP